MSEANPDGVRSDSHLSTGGTSASASPAAVKPHVVVESGTARWRARGILLLVLLVLSMIGLGLTDWDKGKAAWYWVVMIPVFGAINFWLDRGRLHQDGYSLTVAVRKHVLHWLGLLIGFKLLFVLVIVGILQSEEAGLVALIMLAMTSFLAGVHFDWMFMLVGGVLGIAVLVAAYLQQYFLMVMIPLCAVIAVMGFLLRKKSLPKG